PKIDAHEIRRLHFELPGLFAEAVQTVLEKSGDKTVAPDFVASHGHTLAHIPPVPGRAEFGTLQIGDPAVLAHRLGLPVISDFRPRDMAAGGQGAPLVPYADWVLFRQKQNPVICLNIGGIANVTVVTPKLEDVLAFDTGPGNMPIDGVMRVLSREKHHMDEHGATAAHGQAIESLFLELTDHPYFKKTPPKSTGREEFSVEEFMPQGFESRKDWSPEDIVATVTKAVAFSITDAIQRFVLPLHSPEQIVVSGGGVHNRTLRKHLRDALPAIPLRTSDELGLPGDTREAIAFAILGNETIMNVPANVPSATGASHPTVLGKIVLP
ncbi:MAG: anhydro-N-acetylmuramic acid kinase, partial [Candidatus Hydrogenedentales bacterium]